MGCAISTLFYREGAVMGLETVFELPTAEQSWQVVKETWTVPAGVIFLYVYGLSHFNTPFYTIEVPSEDGTSIRLITQTPPKLTTTRARYHLYASSYAFILQVVFLVFIFSYPTISDALSVRDITAPNLSGPLQHRVFIALFLITGVLTSFPLLNRADKWLLEELHRRALIPDESRHLAKRLYQSEFTPTEDVFASVRASLTTRDIVRVAQGISTGSLEKRVIELLCLTTNVHKNMHATKYREFKIKLEKDFNAIESQMRELREDVKSYLRWQARVIPEIDDIDDYISAHDNGDTAELSRRRLELTNRSNEMFEMMCLVVSLAVCATNVRQSDAEDAIKKLGFKTSIGVLPIFDLESIVFVTGTTVVTLLIFSGLYSTFGTLTGISIQHPEWFPARMQVLKFSILLASAFAIIMTLTIRLKRYWRAKRQNVKRSEAIRVALFSYPASLWVNMAISYVFNGTVFTPMPYIFAINQAVLGYFLAKYVDNALSGSRVNVGMSLLQGFIQGAVAGLAASFGSNLSVLNVGFAIIQWTAAGCLSGLLFQYVYGKAVSHEKPVPIVVQSSVRNAEAISLL
jgi:hypothetical protein